MVRVIFDPMVRVFLVPIINGSLPSLPNIIPDLMGMREVGTLGRIGRNRRCSLQIVNVLNSRMSLPKLSLQACRQYMIAVGMVITTLAVRTMMDVGL